MIEIMIDEVENGILKIRGHLPGPETIIYDDIVYYRFMDYFYIKNPNLDELAPDEVSNLCRARAKFPELISPVNLEVRSIFRKLATELRPSSLLEIGAGMQPLFAEDERKPRCYILADADFQVAQYHTNSELECYVFSNEICELPHFTQHFEMVIAVFVLHFPFHKKQLLQIDTRIKDIGVFVANVYRRSEEARKSLTEDIQEIGFEIIKIFDTKDLCRDHEYWIIGKKNTRLEACATALRKILDQI